MMFSVIANFYNYLFGGKETNDKLEEWPDSSFIRNNQIFQSRDYEGFVTHLFSEKGLIDGEIYFEFDCISGCQKLHIGDKVSLVAKQQHEDGGWYGENVKLVSSEFWDDENDPEDDVKSACVGKITSVGRHKGFINDSIEFHVDDCQYAAHVGDWVTAELETLNLSEGDKTEARCVQPLRPSTFEGEITAVMQDHGYIDGEIYFSLEACAHNYKPRKWDRVKVTAIESHQRRCLWRAVHIVQCSSDDRRQSHGRNRKPRPEAAGGEGWVVPGQRPLRSKLKIQLPHKLPQYPVPDQLRECVWEDGELTEHAPELAEVLSVSNYTLKLSTLLHLEEIQQEIDIRQFDMHRVCLRRVGEYLALAVPGLAEGRPSVLVGDKIILSDPGDSDGPYYEGFVHELHSGEVLLKFNVEFQGRYNGEDYNVEFTFNRTTLRRCHQAVHLAIKHLGDTVLFPSFCDTKLPQVELHKPSKSGDIVKLQTNYVGFGNTKSSGESGGPQEHLSTVNTWTQDKVKFFNKRLNPSQKSAVVNVLLGQGRPVPYIIFGPPGTGKTMTMVEAILQVYCQIPYSRIIACAPSNSAADLLAERLVSSGLLKESSLVRLNAFNRGVENIPEAIEKYCSFGDNLQVISRYRIVVCTCVSAGGLYMLGLKAGHFTHAFVDEAGQATEPECLIPLGLVAGADGQIVLAGDPKQLGPVLMSKFSKMYGLELSFLERLMERSLYSRNEKRFADHGGFDSMLVTMLVNNYRSHPAILELPSRLFYYSQLDVVADPALTHSLCGWDMLPRKDIPVIFHGVRGDDMRETDSPSWFNPMETLQVVSYLQSLLNDPAFSLTVDDIGIITPYRKQVEKIRLLIDKLGVDMVKVGSVEEFQGQERQVIIISTVRSNERLVGFDVRHTLGFLSNAKRFNVSITRAQALLIVVGNPFVLCQDEKWMSMIQYCVEIGAYTGCDVPDFSKYTDMQSHTYSASSDTLEDKDSSVEQETSAAQAPSDVSGMGAS